MLIRAGAVRDLAIFRQDGRDLTYGYEHARATRTAWEGYP